MKDISQENIAYLKLKKVVSRVFRKNSLFQHQI